MSRTTMAVLITLLLAGSSSASNVYFFPGDAFFNFEIDQSNWKALQDGELQLVNYHRPKEMGYMFCGFIGYRQLDVSCFSDRFREQLIKGITLMKKKYPSGIIEIDHGQSGLLLGPSGIEKRETNKIPVFVYDKSFDFSKYRIGLKYNESWPDEAVRIGYKRDHFNFEFFVPDGLKESWKYGSAVSRLVEQVPASDAHGFRTPMKIDAAQVKFLVCPPVSMKELCFPSRDSALECFSVSENQIVKLVNDRREDRKAIWLESN